MNFKKIFIVFLTFLLYWLVFVIIPIFNADYLLNLLNLSSDFFWIILYYIIILPILFLILYKFILNKFIKNKKVNILSIIFCLLLPYVYVSLYFYFNLEIYGF